MTSIIKVDTIQSAAGSTVLEQTNATTITLGLSGQTISIPSGATLTNNGTASGFISDGSITMAKLSTSATEGDNVKQRVAKVWVKWNGTGTPAIDDDFNVSSIGDGGTGIFTVNFSSNLGNANYALAGSVGGNSGRILGQEGTYSTSAVTVRVNDFNGNLSDETRNSVIIFGDSA